MVTGVDAPSVASRSAKAAVKTTLTWGRRAERVTVPDSSRLMTSTITDFVPVLPVLSMALTVISYMLSLAAAGESSVPAMSPGIS